MIRKECDGVRWLEFELLQEFPSIRHAVVLKGREASAAVTDANQNRVQQLLKLSAIVESKQVHGNTIEYVESGYVPRTGCDGLVTAEQGTGLMIKHADCQAAIFYDPVLRVIANVHCGWRGNVANIYAATLAFLKEKVGSQPENVFVCISPSLGPSRSEFIHYKQEFPESFWGFQWKENYFNLWEISRSQLVDAGVLRSHIEIAGICTYENTSDYFSYRRDKTAKINNATLIGLSFSA